MEIRTFNQKKCHRYQRKCPKKEIKCPYCFIEWVGNVNKIGHYRCGRPQEKKKCVKGEQGAC
jgi:hypothetical protein